MAKNNFEGGLRPLHNNYGGGQKIADLSREHDEEEDIEISFGYNTITTLPLLKINEYSWPKRLQQLYTLTDSTPLQDAVFLAALALLPFSIAPKLRVRYNYSDFYCTPMLLFAAPPASGKGIVGDIFHLLDVEDKRRRDIYAQEKAEYDKKKLELSQMGKAKAREEVLKEPALYFAKVSANNTASGLSQNISDCKGHCAIVDTEMYILAQSTDRKGFGDPTSDLCKAWSHEDLSMNRRTNNENLYVPNPIVSMVMTGTPSQIAALIKSPENGFFTRVLYYHIPIDSMWHDTAMDTFNSSELKTRSVRNQVVSFAKEWEALLHQKFDSVSDIRLVVSMEQRDLLNSTFCWLNDRAAASNEDMLSYVHRLAPNLLRLCTSLALIRALEPENAHLGLLRPRVGTNEDNVKDGICPSLDLLITDEDFYAMIDMAEKFYLHAAHSLSLLKESDTVSKQTFDRDIFFDQMTDTFTTLYAIEYGKSIGASDRTIRNWIIDFIKHGKLKRIGRGVYIKSNLYEEMKR